MTAPPAVDADIEVGLTIPPPSPEYFQGPIKDKLLEFGLVVGTSASNGHCLFSSMDCCRLGIRHARVGNDGNYVHPVDADRVMAIRNKLGSSLLRHENDCEFFQDCPWIIQHQAENPKLPLKKCVRAFWCARKPFSAMDPLPKPLWGGDWDLLGLRRVMGKDIFVFASQPGVAQGWYLTRYFMEQRATKRATVRVQDWVDAFGPTLPDALFLLNSEGHFSPVLNLLSIKSNEDAMGPGYKSMIHS